MKALWQKATESAAETYRGCAWVFTELVSDYAKKQVCFSLVFLIGSTTALMATQFIMKYVIDAHANGNTDQAVSHLWHIALIGAAGTICASLHDHFRERAWNRNYFTVHTRLVNRLFQRSLDEIISEDSEVGAEQIESLKDRVANIMYLFLFESSIVLATIFGATGFLFLVDQEVGFFALGLTTFNFAWFFFLNASLDEKMEPIDKAFRRATRRLVEKLNLAHSVKAGGVEKKIETQIGGELSEPLEKDFKIWGYWFQMIDFWRRLLNTLAPIIVLLFGVTSTEWSSGTIAAVSSLIFMISREYGFIGHLMRHLASQVARIKATREALTIPPAFSYEEGIIYERKKDAY